MSYLLTSPLTWGLLLAATLWLSWSRLPRGLRIVGLGLGVLVLLVSTPLGANGLVWIVESSLPIGAHCNDDASRRAPLVVMSGGFDRAPRTKHDYAALSQASWTRLRGAVALRGDGERMMIAGGGPYAVKESVVLAQLARDWGVPAGLLDVETKSTSTWSSAFSLRPMLPTRIRLVSSALHLPRALFAVRAAGFKACVQASDSSYLPPGWPGSFVPQISAMTKSQKALHEVAGLLVYRVRAYRRHVCEQPAGY